jgi:hypothetical protein
MPVIGYLNGESADLSGDRLAGFRQGLSDTGYVEGRNLAIEYRWADGSLLSDPGAARPDTVIPDLRAAAASIGGDTEVLYASTNAVMACDDEIVPLQERIEMVGDDADLREVYDTERHLLYCRLHPCPGSSVGDRGGARLRIKAHVGIGALRLGGGGDSIHAPLARARAKAAALVVPCMVKPKLADGALC